VESGGWPRASSGGDVLDQLASWRKLKAPLELYLEFVRCNYFGDDDDRPTARAERLEDDGTGGSHVDASTSCRAQQDDGRLLQRPRAEPVHITPRCHADQQQR